MKFKPYADRVLIKPRQKKEITSTGLALQENDRRQVNIGEVIAVGEGVPLHNIKLNILGDFNKESGELLKEIIQLLDKGREMRCKVGDMVQYGQHAGTKVQIDGQEYLMIREADIFGGFTEKD